LDRTQPVPPQKVNPVESSCNVPPLPRTLQDDLAATARRVIEQGRNILGLVLPEAPAKLAAKQHCPAYDLQISAPSGSATADPAKL
jgi:hypothetical protein